jgi:hypothetical protein
MATGLKHLITCRCVLPQFKRAPDPPLHQFIVFSVLEDDGTFRPRFAQCNNCGIVHKVVEVSRSEVVHREAMGSLPTIDDIKAGLPPQLANLLEANGVELPTWEMAQFIIEHKQWGNFVVLSTDEEDGLKQGKYVRILSENLFKVETFMREEVVK